jgi:putative transposase
VSSRNRRRFKGDDVTQVLSRVVSTRGLPAVIQCDQGTEFTSMAMDHWAYWNKIRLDFSGRGKPGDNAANEAFIGTERRECLSQHYFTSLEDAQYALCAWRNEHSKERPHGSLAQTPPAVYKAEWSSTQDPISLQKRRT